MAGPSWQSVCRRVSERAHRVMAMEHVNAGRGRGAYLQAVLVGGVVGAAALFGSPGALAQQKAASAPAAVSSPAARAAPTIYQCKNAKGQVTFSDAPCAAGQQSRTVEVAPNTLDSSGSRKATEQTDKLSRTPADAPSNSADEEPASSGRGRSIDPAQCSRAETAYRDAAATAGTSNAELDARAAEAHEACGTSFPRPRVIRHR